MSNLILLVRLKAKLLLRKPLMLSLSLIIPVLLSLLAGASTQRNDLSSLRAAYIDLAHNRESGQLVRMLESSGLGWEAADPRQVARSLELGQLDGVVMIPARFGDREHARHIDDAFSVDYLPGKNGMAQDLIRENYLINLLALATVAKLEKDLMSLPGAAGLTDDGINRRMDEAVEFVRKEGTRLEILFHGLESGRATPVINIPDVAVDILFLSVFALLSSLLLADAATHRRLRSLPGGLRRDYLASLVTLTLAGALQLAAMVGLTLLLMPGTARPPGYLPVMATLFLFMQAFGQFVALLPADRRFVPASLILFLSILAGGSLVHLPSQWMTAVGQFTPHGWALARLSGQATVLGVIPAALIGLGLLWAAYVIQKRSDHLAA